MLILFCGTDGEPWRYARPPAGYPDPRVIRLDLREVGDPGRSPGPSALVVDVVLVDVPVG